ncbi:hypothetical protein ACFWP5_45090 [Streptomyces sp. NPDC058469]
MLARTLPSRSATDLIAERWWLRSDLDSVPRTLAWDGEGAVGT